MRMRLVFGSAVLLLVIPFMIGCSAVKPERQVNKNVFFSERYPKVLIEVDPKMKYLGKTEKTASATNMDQIHQKYPYETTSFVFCEAGPDGAISRSSFIQIMDCDCTWSDNMLSKIRLKGTIDYGTENIGGAFFRYAVAPGKITDQGLKSIYIENGLNPDGCYLARSLARIEDRRDIIVYITYIENISGEAAWGGCGTQQLSIPITGEQEKFLLGFLKRSESSLRFLDGRGGVISRITQSAVQGRMPPFRRASASESPENRRYTNCENEMKNIIMSGGKIALFVNMPLANNTCDLQKDALEEWRLAIKNEVRSFYHDVIYQYTKLTTRLSVLNEEKDCNHMLNIEYNRYCESKGRIVDVTLLKMVSKEGSKIIASDTIKREKALGANGKWETVRCFLNGKEVVEGKDGKSLYVASPN